MKPQTSQGGYSASRRGGSRRSRSHRGSSRRSGGYQSHQKNRKTKPKRSLWQRIVAFFTGRKSNKRFVDRVNPKTDRSHSPTFSKHSEEAGHGDTSSSRRKPEIVDVLSPRLYVGNLSYDATESDLSELFNGVGKVQNVEIISYRHNQRSKGFAFVQMQSIEEARRAVEQLHDKEFLGRKLFVSGAKNVEQRSTASDHRDEDSSHATAVAPSEDSAS